MNIVGIIPARYSSSRFPGKPLVIIKGKSMIQRVYQQACKSKLLSKVFVATDDKRIYDHVKAFGGECIMTSSKHNTGTERCTEAISKIHKLFPSKKYNVVINIQGDEPFIDPTTIDKLAALFKKKDVEIASLIKKISSEEELVNPNVVKVLVDDQARAIIFSRFPVPYVRGFDQEKWIRIHTFFKHIGIYAYRTNVLLRIAKLKPSLLEKAESLEQLRWIEHGYKIYIIRTSKDSIAIDSPEDLNKIKVFK